MHPSEGGSQPDLLMQNEREKIKARVHVPQAIQFCLCLACSITNVTSKQQPGWLVRSASPYQPYTFTVSATLAPLLSLLTLPPHTPPCSLLHLAVKLMDHGCKGFYFLVEGEGKILSSVALQFPGSLSPVLHHSRLNSPAFCIRTRLDSVQSQDIHSRAEPQPTCLLWTAETSSCP